MPDYSAGRPISLVLDHLPDAKEKGQGKWQARCPAHEDKQPSLTITEKTDGTVLLHCHAGCDKDDVLSQMGLEVGDLFVKTQPANDSRPDVQRSANSGPPPPDIPARREETGQNDPKGPPPPNIPKQSNPVAPSGPPIYVYDAEDGERLLRKHRIEKPGGGKDFRWQHWDGTEWQSGFGIHKPVLYRQREISQAIEDGQTVYVVEGEKDVDRLTKLGLPATTAENGAQSWRTEYAELFVRATVVIVPDNDEPGRNYARVVAESLMGVAASVKVVELPNLPEHGDVSDWLSANGTGRTDLETLVENAPKWTPPVRFLFLDGAGLKKMPHKTWLIADVCGAGDLVVIYGPPGCGKTFVVLDMLVALLTQEFWAETFEIAPGRDREARPLHVVYCAEEGKSSLPARFEAAYGDDLATLSGLSVCLTVPQLFQGGDSVGEFMQDYRLQHDAVPDMVVIDTLASAAVGADENSARDMGLALDATKQFIREWGSTAVLLHHSRKDSESERGSTALRGAADTMIMIGGEDLNRTLECAKQKDGLPFKGLGFSLIQHHEEDRSAYVKWQGSGALTTRQSEVLAAFRDVKEPIGAGELGKRIDGMDQRSIRPHLNTLVKLGYLSSQLRDMGKPSSPQNPWLYSLSGANRDPFI